MKDADDPDRFQCQINEIHPYDLAEYAWIKKDQPASAGLFKNNRFIGRVDLPEYDEDDYEKADEYIDEVIDRMIVELKDANRNVEPMIDHT